MCETEPCSYHTMQQNYVKKKVQEEFLLILCSIFVFLRFIDIRTKVIPSQKFNLCGTDNSQHFGFSTCQQ